MRTQFDLITQAFLFTSLLVSIWKFFPWMQELRNYTGSPVKLALKHSLFDYRWRASQSRQRSIY